MARRVNEITLSGSGRSAAAACARRFPLIPRPTLLDPRLLSPSLLEHAVARQGRCALRTTRAQGTLSWPMLTLGQRVQHPRLLQVSPELLALRVSGLRRHRGSETGARGPEQEEGTGVQQPRLTALGPQDLRARAPTPSRSRPAGGYRPYSPATPRPSHFVMGHSDWGNGVAGAGDRGRRARSSTAHAQKPVRACVFASHGPCSLGCGLFSW